jgi:hypothetical protein
MNIMKASFAIAVITTAYYANSHADVMVSRWLAPLATGAEWGWPNLDADRKTHIASLYIDPWDHPHNDDPHREIGRSVAQQYGVPVFDSLEDALTLGTGTLMVDAVLFIGEHGDFPLNELGQKLYPRYEYWVRIAEVIRASGRRIPVFLDKHLSYDRSKASQMVAQSREWGIRLMAGSSLSHCKLEPPIQIDAGTVVEEAVGVFYGGAEVYGFHMLEVAEAILENRSGNRVGGSGIRRVRVLHGIEVWTALDDGLCCPDLLQSALSVAENVKHGDPRQNALVGPGKDGIPTPLVFSLEYEDGLRASYFLLRGHLEDFALAIRDRNGCVQAGRVHGGDADDFYANFAALDRDVEDFFLSGIITAPIERTLLTTCTISYLMEAALTLGEWIDTPDLVQRYVAPGLVRARWPVTL